MASCVMRLTRSSRTERDLTSCAAAGSMLGTGFLLGARSPASPPAKRETSTATTTAEFDKGPMWATASIPGALVG